MPPNRLSEPRQGAEIRLLGRTFLCQYQLRLVNLYGGEPGIRDAGVLEDMLESVQILVEEGADIFVVAGRYVEGLLSCPFSDSNLRLAVIAMGTVIRVNGFRFNPPAEVLLDMISALNNRALDTAALTEWLRAQSTPVESDFEGESG